MARGGFAMRHGMVAGNWKMHGSRQFNADYVRELDDCLADEDTVQESLVVIPPVGFLTQLGQLLSSAGLTAVELGAQNLHPAENGAFTGEMSAEMLKDLGADWILVGHSERRQLANESNELVSEKVVAALRAGLKPMLCIGETEAERGAGRAERVVIEQLSVVVERCGIEALADAAVAYEPVWAIGTGKTATPELAQDMHRVIRTAIADWSESLAGQIPLLYGGSVKSSNAAQLFAQPDIDGGLVGGASLQAAEFVEIGRCLGASST